MQGFFMNAWISADYGHDRDPVRKRLGRGVSGVIASVGGMHDDVMRGGTVIEHFVAGP
jgi:hypothetical protein